MKRSRLHEPVARQRHQPGALDRERVGCEGHLTLATAGSNGLVTTSSFEATTGRLINVATGTGNAVQNLSYTYDRLGNPLSRSDANTSLSETFAYDGLDRLTATTVNLTPAPLAKILLL